MPSSCRILHQSIFKKGLPSLLPCGWISRWFRSSTWNLEGPTVVGTFFFLKVLAGMMLKKTRSLWFFETRQLKIHYLFGGFFHGKIINGWCPITMLDYRRVFFRFLEINTAKMNWKAKNDSTLPYFCEQDDSAADLGVPYFQTNPNNPSPVLRSLVLRSRTPEAPSEWWLWGKSVANLRAKWSLGRPPVFFVVLRISIPWFRRTSFSRYPRWPSAWLQRKHIASRRSYRSWGYSEDSSAGRGSKYRPVTKVSHPSPSSHWAADDTE